jgi:uncharacterized membrane protein
MSNAKAEIPPVKVYPNEKIKSSLEFKKTHTDSFAMFMTKFLGSMTFLGCAVIFFSLWIVYNLFSVTPFDRFPFPELQTVVSIFAIILSVTVLINQNRQGRMDKITKEVEFEVNVRAEHEITKMLNMLHEIHQKLGLESDTDKELEEMKETTDVQQIHQTIDDKEGDPKN